MEKTIEIALTIDGLHVEMNREVDAIEIHGDFAVIPIQCMWVEWLYAYSITHVPSGFCVWPDVKRDTPGKKHNSKKFVCRLAKAMHESGLADMIGLDENKNWTGKDGARKKLNEVLAEMEG
jgi:hypothetical protein